MTSGRTLTCADTLHRGPSFWVGVAGIADALWLWILDQRHQLLPGVRLEQRSRYVLHHNGAKHSVWRFPFPGALQARLCFLDLL
jgi:hypothetical protein